jgi:HlyD family secretion protein
MKTWVKVAVGAGVVVVLSYCRLYGSPEPQERGDGSDREGFKVVVTVEDPPEDLRPGLSATAKITTATRSHALSVPIQALTVRSRADLEQQPEKGSVQAAAPQNDASKKKDDEVQGVFVVRNKKVEFVGDEILTGSYKVLRTIKPGASVKIDNSAPKKEEEEGSS